MIKKMRIKLIILSVLLLFLLVECKVKKTNTPELLTPLSYPDDLTEAGKPDFIKNYNKGHILYNINCAKCHNITMDGKTVIPDFSLPQLMDYEIRIQYPDHQEPMRETNLGPEELEQVILFLRYKRPGNSG